MLDDAEIRCTAAKAAAMFADERVTVPAGWEPLWRVFLDLHETRSEGFTGPAPIKLAEIDAYIRLMGTPLEPRHVVIIRAIDKAWLARIAEKRATAAAPPPLTADLFRAMFG